MASTSVSSVQRSFKYDVFLSFRGEDTRKTFVDHLYHALTQKSIITYKDDERIEKGERISDQLLRSIEDSRFHIIVFSKNYASSSWCLDELAKIMECQKTAEQTAYPIFYDVEPTEVRNQSGAVGNAFAKHEGSTGKRKRALEDVDLEDDVGRWRNALKEAAGLAGMELKNTSNGYEATFIQKVVHDISLKLHFTNVSIDGTLVGMETRVKNIVSSLDIGSDDVRMIGIKGMGGGGKTTLARAVFDHISIWFEGRSFVENVREISKGSLYGMQELQKQILKDVSNDRSIDVTSVSDGKYMMKKIMVSQKALVVLDDVDDIDQLEALAGEGTWFKPGSRIIITSRDRQVLVAHGVNFIHDVNLLSHEEAICLFSRYAFKREIPNQGYETLSGKVVEYAAGLPLTIKVLGSHLCGRTEDEWADAIERLKTIPLEKTLKRLELSYNGLEDDQKEIFLDVVCILKGGTKDRAIKTLESCGLNAQIGLGVLEQKSLISISDIDGLRFHDHIEEMGWNIVRRLHHDEPNKHSRLWITEEINDILVNELGTEATRSIKLQYSRLHPATIMQGLRNMRELRCLYVDDIYSEWKDDEVSQYLPDTLQSLYWAKYPFRSLPKLFQGKMLVNLEMVWSNIRVLCEGEEYKGYNRLRFLDLSYSKLETLDLGMTPNLEMLDLRGCNDFVELHMPIELPKLKFLTLNGSKVSNLKLGMTPHLKMLDLGECYDFVELYMPVECLNLESLDLTKSKVSKLNLGMTPSLKMLDLGRCYEFVELHMPVECLKLESLYLGGSKVSKLNLRMTPCLKTLDLRRCFAFVELHMPVECPKLEFLDLTSSKVSNMNLEMTPNLKSLNLALCFNFVELRMPVECPKLESLNLSGSKVSNLNLGLSPNLRRLDIEGCYHLQEIKAPMGCLKNIIKLNLSYCFKFHYFKLYKLSESAGLDSVATFDLIAKSLDICPLHPNNSLPKFQFICKYDEPLSSWSGNLERLISFGVCACTNLESCICGLQHVNDLTLECIVPEVLKDLWQLESLKRLTLWVKEIKHLPDSIYMLKHLKYLNISYCSCLEQLPENICRLECLEELHLSYCILLERLPDGLGRLECLNKLNIKGAGISHLPHSIYQLNGLQIIGSRGQLESYGFTSLTEDPGYTDYYYVEL